MAKAQPVTIGNHFFEKKGDALNHFKEMLNRYSIEERVSDEDAEFLFEALKNHPEADEKAGVGIDGFIVRRADYGTNVSM
jgi:hypothetical protein